MSAILLTAQQNTMQLCHSFNLISARIDLKHNLKRIMQAAIEQRVSNGEITQKTYIYHSHDEQDSYEVIIQPWQNIETQSHIYSAPKDNNYHSRQSYDEVVQMRALARQKVPLIQLCLEAFYRRSIQRDTSHVTFKPFLIHEVDCTAFDL